MTVKLVNKVKMGYLSAFILLLICFFVSFYFSQKLNERSGWIIHTLTVQNKVEQLVSFVKDAETGVRGYVVMRDSSFLKPYINSHERVDSVYRMLKNLTMDNASEQKNLDALNKLIQNKFAALAYALSAIPKDSFQLRGYVNTLAYNSAKVMDSIRTIGARMEADEQALLEQRIQTFSASTTAINVVTTITIIVAIIITIFTFITYTSENINKEKAREKADNYRQQLEKRVEELNKANKELIELRRIEKFAVTGRVARVIAHEIRNPLTNIGLASEQLRAEVKGEEDLSILFDMIDRNSKRINQLITELLNSTKFAQLEFSEIAVNDLLDYSLSFARDRIELKNIKLEKNYASTPVNLSVDKEKMNIALLNLIINAVEAMEAGKGILRITTEVMKNSCRITIADNGVGIDEESLVNIFEPYYSTKKGTGLGLTNTQNIILNHKGSITVESRLNSGTSFIITLSAPEIH